MKQKSTARAPLFSAGLWLAYGLLETVFGLGAAHALTLVLLGLLAWFALYLIGALSPPEEPCWKMHVRIAAVTCVTVGVSVLLLRASQTVTWVALGAFAVVVAVGTAWASRPIRHTG